MTEPVIHDAGGGEAKPDLSPEVMLIVRAVERLRRAGEACDAHRPPFSGEDWDRKSQEFADARDDLYALPARIREGRL